MQSAVATRHGYDELYTKLFTGLELITHHYRGDRTKILIFRTDIRDGTTAATDAQIMSINASTDLNLKRFTLSEIAYFLAYIDDPSQKVYSRLSELSTFRSARDRKWHFALYYPEISEDKAFTWKQKDDPFTVTSKI